MEVWRSIPNYENFEVSSDGNVRQKGQINMRFSLDKGYHRVSLDKDFVLVQKLVMSAFNPRPLTNVKLVIRHLNHNKSDNRLLNLEWATQKVVCKAAVKAGLAPNNSGGNNGMAKLKEAAVKTIRKNYKKGDEIKLAEQYNVKVSTIMNVVKRKTWKNVA